jgi:Haem-binding domain
MPKNAPRSILFVLLAAIVFFGLIQLVPYGRNHTNPPVVQEPNWDSPQTRQLAARACFDCHSNQTTYPWYSNIAPVSWLTERDVVEGRRRLNFSQWNGTQGRVNEVSRIVSEGEMPPFYYVWMHPSANLTSDQKTALVNGLNATFGISPN